MSVREQRAEEELQIAQEALEEAKLKLKRATGARRWKCPSCRVWSRLDSLEVEVVNFYVVPHGCSEGDYWTEGSQPDFHVACPVCGVKTCIYHLLDGYDLIERARERYALKSVTLRYQG